MRISFTSGYKDIIPNDESYRLRAIMGSNEINLKFSLFYYFEFPLGSFVNFQGQRYTLNSPATITEINSTHFDYSMVLGSPQDLLRNYKIKDTQGRLKFPITAKPSEHLELLVHNLNQNNGGWSVGECIEKHEKLISYNHTNCYDALQTIASEFKTEFEIVGKTIHLRKVEYNKDNPLPLSYGMGNGFKSGVGRNNDSQKAGFNVLYVQGGERNIDLSKYGNKELLLPKNQRYTYEGVTYQTDAKGLSISVVGDISVTENRKEESLDLTHIYPKRVGSVSEVVVVDKEKHFYDFKDSSIPNNLDFSQCRMDGNKITIRFESGMLAGREFDIQQDDKSLAGYIHAERRFKLVPKEEDGYTMPNDTFKPEIGDKYAVFNMQMPDAYICDNASKTGASWELFKEACKHFYENHESKFTFKGILDWKYAKDNWLNIGGKIRMGGFIRFSDPKFQPEGIDIRIISVKDYLNNPHSPEIDLANSVQGGSIATELDKIKENEVVREDLHKRSIDYTKRRFRDAEETTKMLVNSKLNFGKGINPMYVNAMQLLVGDKSLQFRFVNSMRNPQKVEHSFTYDQKRKVLKTSGGILQHLTLGIDAVKPNQVYKFWNVTPFESPALTEEKKSYYLYVKANKSNQNASFVLSEKAIGLEEVSGYYHLLTGLLNSEFEGERSFVKMYGFTEILPGQIKVDKWSSSDGQQYIEFAQNRINFVGNVRMMASSPAFAQIASVQDVKIGSAEQRAKNYTTTQINQAKADAERQRRRLSTEIEQNLRAFTDFRDNTYQAFADGIVTEPEKQAIKSQKQLLENEKADLLKECTEVLNDPNLPTNENNLLNAIKSAYVSAFDSLIRAINNATDDGAITDSERTAVNNGFTSYRTALENLRKKLVESIKVIEQVKIDSIEVGNRNYFRNFNSWDFNSGFQKTILDGGNGVRLRTNSSVAIAIGSNLISREGKCIVSFRVKTLTAVNIYFGVRGSVYKSSHENLRSGTNFNLPANFDDTITIYFTTSKIDDKNVYVGVVGTDIVREFELHYPLFLKGNKLLDWTPAPEDTQAEIDQAKQGAETARRQLAKELNDSKRALTDFESRVNGAFRDGVLTEAEKGDIRHAREQIKTENLDIQKKYDKIYNDENLKGKVKSVLKSKFDIYHQYSNSILVYGANLLDLTKIDSDTERSFRYKISDYRLKLADLRDAFEDAVKFIEQVKIDSIKVGNRNYFRNFNSWIFNSGFEKTILDGGNGVRLRTNSNVAIAIGSNLISREGKCIVSFRVKTLTAVNIYFGVRGSVYKSSHENLRSGTNFNLPANFDDTITIYFTTSKIDDKNVYVGVVGTDIVREFELHYPLFLKGNKLLDWTPAPEDTQAEIKYSKTQTKNELAQNLGYTDFEDLETKAAAGKTLIKGGVINTELINAVAIVSKYLETNLLIADRIISVNDGIRVNINANAGNPFEVFNSMGVKQLELREENGSVQYIYRNKGGDIIWYMGEDGFKYTQFTSEKWVPKKLKFIGTNKSSINDSSFGIRGRVVDDSKRWLGDVNIDPEQNQHWEITKSTNGKTYYEYLSATNAKTKVDATNHGITFKSKSKTSDNKIPDGYYYYTDSNIVVQMISTPDGEIFMGDNDIKRGSTPRYGVWRGIHCVKFTSGKITESFNYIF